MPMSGRSVPVLSGHRQVMSIWRSKVT
jgi:hypothetical protein